jgi:hypothetical protein
MFVLGIDPGKDGGFAVVDGKGNCLCCEFMPQTEKDVWEIIKSFALRFPELRGIIEKVNAFPGQGIASAWKFSGGYHGLRMAMIGNGIPFTEIPPRVWQQKIGMPPRKKTETKTQWKNRLKGKAQQIFPDRDVTLKTADALLIAFSSKS